jgi:hypothetical protein
MNAVVAKMNCHYIQTQDFGYNAQYHKVMLGAVYGQEGENKDFADATPSGECWMNINTGRPALGFFKPNKKYYVTFTEAPD